MRVLDNRFSFFGWTTPLLSCWTVNEPRGPSHELSPESPSLLRVGRAEWLECLSVYRRQLHPLACWGPWLQGVNELKTLLSTTLHTLRPQTHSAEKGSVTPPIDDCGLQGPPSKTRPPIWLVNNTSIMNSASSLGENRIPHHHIISGIWPEVTLHQKHFKV